MYTLTVKGNKKSLQTIQKRFRGLDVVFELTEEKQQAKKPVKRKTTKKQVKKEQ